MRDAVSEPAAAGDVATPAGGARARLRALWERLPAALRRRLRLFRVTRWRLAVLGAVLLVVLAWGAVAVSSTTMYSTTVLFEEQEGGIGIPPPFESLDFGDVPRGMSMHRDVILENNGKLDSYVLIFSWGGIRDFLSIDDAFFNIAPGEEHNVDFSVRAPANAPAERKSGRVFVVRVPWWWPW
jgi:hypothetical protein